MSGPFQVAGYAIGYYFGGPGMAAAGAGAGSRVDNWLWPNVSKGPKIERVRPQISSFGEVIPRLWGTQRMAGNVIWAPDVREVEVVTEVGDAGGCNGGWMYGITGLLPGDKFITYEYYADLAIGLCEGPVERIIKIWADSRLIYNVGTVPDDQEGGITTPTNRVAQMSGLKFKLYNGSETQTADPTMVARGDPAPDWRIPGHRGLAYVVIKDFPLVSFGNRIPSFNFEVSTSVTNTAEWEALLEIESTIWGSDNIVAHPNGMFITFMAAGYWNKLNTITNTLEVQVYNPDIPDASDFDIDENDFVHTTATCATPNRSYLCYLDGDTYDVIATSDAEVYTPAKIRVFRNPIHPYVAAIAVGGSSLYVTHRYDHTFGTMYTIRDLAPPGGLNWWSMSLDNDNGVIWALARDWNGVATTTKVVKIQVYSGGDCAQTVYDITADVNRGTEILFDRDSDQVIVGSTDAMGVPGSDGRIAFFDAGTMEHITTLTDGPYMPSWSKSAWRRGAVNGVLYFTFGTNVVTLDLYSHTINTWSPGTPGPGNMWGGSIYDPITHSVIAGCMGAGFSYAKVYIDRCLPGTVPLSEIVTDICERCGLSSGEIDVTELTDDVHGYLLNSGGSGRDALQPLMEAFFFDAVESDGYLKFLKRGRAVSSDIPEDALAAHVAGNERPQRLITTRQEDVELPQEVRVIHYDPWFNYQEGVQRERRIVTDSKHVAELHLPIALTVHEAKRTAICHLAYAWLQRNRHKFFLPREYMSLEPTDVVTVTEGDRTHRVRIEEILYADGVLAIDAVDDDPDVYVSTASGTLEDIGTEDVDYPGQTRLVLIDCPLLKSTTNQPGIYMATLSYLDTWRGALVYKSNDQGSTWSQWAASNRDAVLGKATTALADVIDPWVWDEGNTVNIRLLDGQDSLEDGTVDEVLNGANVAILGDEIIQWKTATLESNGSYTLSGLLRGCKGTEWATGDHAVGENFVVLDALKINFVSIPVEEMALERRYAVISVGMDWSTALSQDFTWHARNMMPLSPCHITGERNGSDDLLVSWKRRTRYSGEWLDETDIPLGETSEAYEAEIYADGVLVRTVTGITTNNFTYTSTEQLTDGIAPGEAVTVRVYQISSLVGRGFPGEETV